jgi:beta-lactamase class C
MSRNTLRCFTLLLILAGSFMSSFAAAGTQAFEVTDAVDKVILPLMQKENIPGMAVAVTIRGKSYFFNYGVASRETRQRITRDTLFEIGSISKTFTATLASYAQISGNLSLSESASKYLPSLRGSGFDNISLINLGTHTAGGLPLQVPDEIKTDDELMDYFKKWTPIYAAGAYRAYSNLSVGLLGRITAQCMHQAFEEAMEKKLFPELGMTRSYITVPANQMARYAQGYTAKDEPIRMSLGILASETYGVKSTSADMIRFVTANMQRSKIGDKLRRAIVDTHTGYYRSGDLTQDLIWEQYPYPVELKQLLAGNSYTMINQANVATRFIEPLRPQQNVLIDKTGSTNGFGSYVAFIPAKKLGIVLLANKNYPIDARVTAAFEILARLNRL